MRDNQPVTQKEQPFPKGVTLMSSTDADSRIRYANAPFTQISGYSNDELVGEPHNLVRHPDVPPEAFADLWATVKGGDSWTALVKNRCKNGDHYWVRANVTPMHRQGRLVGYMSVRTEPLRSEVQAADKLFARMRQARARGEQLGVRLHKGLLVRTGALAWLSANKTLGLSARVGLCGLLALAPAALALGALDLPASALATGMGALVLGLLLGGWALHSQVVGPIRRILTEARRVAAGEPAKDAHLERVDELGMLMRAVSQAGLNLVALLDDVAEQSAGLATASKQIAAGSLDLSARTESQAASLQQTAASMEQLSATVKHNAESAQQASTRAGTASHVAESGGKVMTDAVGTMEHITASSKRISEIIGVIEGIAFQTNILALNAAVEAARAGEQGRGFAVVASEVRSLAQRSAQAAHEITDLIGKSVQSVESGSRLVNAAGQTMRDIVEQVQDVTRLAGEISHSTMEQSSGIGQVNQAVADLDRVTQQNAALVEESAAAADGLSMQAARLQQAVSAFRPQAV